MGEEQREHLGRLVRAAWVEYCHKIGDTKPSHTAPWEELDEADREADRVIGEVVALQVLRALMPDRMAEFAPLLKLF